jgi:hypothetical protein
MSASLLYPAEFEIGVDADAPYTALLLEADFRMGRRGKETRDRLVESLERVFNPDLSLGWFDLLDCRSPRED